MTRSTAVFLVAWVAGCGGSAPAAECPEVSSGGESTATHATMEEDIRELLVITNAIGNAQQMMAPMLTALAQAYPSVPHNVWSELVASMGNEDFTELLIDIYKRNYTRPEVIEMLRFYRSDLGQSILSKMPKVIAEGQQAGGEWGQRFADRLLEGARQRGYEL
jgi:hypothetical protein